MVPKRRQGFVEAMTPTSKKGRRDYVIDEMGAKLPIFGRFPGEENDLETVREIGRRWGFGNCIDILHREWDKILEKDGIKDHSLHWMIAAGENASAELERRKNLVPIKPKKKGGKR